jgi:hypothetical protein
MPGALIEDEVHLDNRKEGTIFTFELRTIIPCDRQDNHDSALESWVIYRIRIVEAGRSRFGLCLPENSTVSELLSQIISK